nr:putative phage tail protein [uncultured Pseudomonas sp.]
MTTMLDQLRLLLPPMSYNPLAATISALMAADANALDAGQASGDRVYQALWPATGTALEDWERVLGLPDDCSACAMGAAQTPAQRISGVLAKLLALGGQSRAYFIQLAASLGYVVTITEFRPARAGFARAGDAVNGPEWTTAYRIDVRAANADPVLECRLRAVAPAHATVVFAYGAA